MGRLQLLLAGVFGLALVALAWFIRSGRWRQQRLLLLTAALLAAVMLLSRRVGWSELLVVLAVLALPAILFAPGRPRR